jgi:hypothetical protein
LQSSKLHVPARDGAKKYGDIFEKLCGYLPEKGMTAPQANSNSQKYVMPLTFTSVIGSTQQKAGRDKCKPL